MVQALIGSLLICALTGYALSLVVAALLSQRTRGLSLLGAVAGLLLAVGPIYLGVACVIDQGAGSIILAAGSFAFGLFCLRGWWFPERFVGADSEATAKPSRLAQPEPLSIAYPALRYRMATVVRSDRQLQQARDTPFADAA